MPDARIALVGGSLDEVVKVMIEGESGLRATARFDEPVRWSSSSATLHFASGAQALIYSAVTPDKLRGPQHHFAWCDELAKWPRAQATWDNLKLGLRLGNEPRTLVTTTPRPIPLLSAITADEGTVATGGRTFDNPHLPASFVESVSATYGGTRLGRQELDGELVEELEGALWSRATIERSRADAPRRESLARVVIGVDPPASATGDACGIVVAGLGADDVAYVLADETISGASPERWASAVAGAAERWAADRVIAEANQGGAMVESVLRAAEHDLPVKLRHATRHKGARAEPVATLFERGRAQLAGCFPELEDQLAGLLPGGGYHGPGRSPDRADAMVWAVAELLLVGGKGTPKMREL